MADPRSQLPLMTGGTDREGLTAQQNGVQALNKIAAAIANLFPQLVGLSVTAPSSVGAITFTSSNPAQFFLVTTSSGFQGKVPLYPP